MQRTEITPKVMDICCKWVENPTPNNTYYLYRINSFLFIISFNLDSSPVRYYLCFAMETLDGLHD